MGSSRFSIVLVGISFAAASAAASALPGTPQTEPGAKAPVAAVGAVAEKAGQPKIDKDLFPVPPILVSNRNFWVDVFSKYSENQSLVSDADDPSRIYEILDFRSVAKSMTPEALHRLRDSREQQASSDVIHALRELARDPSRTTGLSAQVLRIKALFPANTSAAQFREAANSVRIQRGIRERTKRALEISGRYMPKMESIFASYGLPIQLTRLPLVESSFNLDAYSKVGAAGIWQFMPSSARLFMTVDAIQDQRRDPWTSTRAAAQHLKADYDALGSWPLAITAYNFGRAGIQRALREIDGKTLTDLLKHYDSARFGFASRNFYAEFLAALEVKRDANKLFGKLPTAKPIQYADVKTKDYVRYATLRKISGASSRTFEMLNPSFSTAVVDGHLYVPPNTLVRIPAGATKQFDTLYAALGNDERFRHQRIWYVAYRVRRGDVLGAIARRHRVSVDSLLRYNHLRSARLIRVGQILRIPVRDSQEHHEYEAVYHEESRRRRYIVHAVHGGQTLSGIAHRYDTSVKAIQRLNGMRHSTLVRAGMDLKIPRRGSRQGRYFYHRVHSGQTLSGIAQRYGTTVDRLMRDNDLRSAKLIRVGMRIKVPRS